MKPSPGRFVYASYESPVEITKAKKKIRLRVQGVGNMRRDYPMRAPAPPIYAIISQTHEKRCGRKAETDFFWFCSFQGEQIGRSGYFKAFKRIYNSEGG